MATPRTAHLINPEFIDSLISFVQREAPIIEAGTEISAHVIDGVVKLLENHITEVGVVLIAAGVLAILPSLAILIVNVIGFTSAGVVKGSLAALLQAVFYGGSTGGLFAMIQSLGATAAVANPALLVAGGTALGLGAGILLKGGDAMAKAATAASVLMASSQFEEVAAGFEVAKTWFEKLAPLERLQERIVL